MDIGGRTLYIGCDSQISYIPGTNLYVEELLFFGFLLHLLAVHAQSDII